MPSDFFSVRDNSATEVLETAFESPLEVRMFNIAKGEAIFVVFPEPLIRGRRRAWLLEGGCKKNLAKLGPALAAYLKEENLTLVAIVLSHPHVDHGGAIKDLLTLISGQDELAQHVTYYRSADPAFGDTSIEWLHGKKADDGSLLKNGLQQALDALAPRLQQTVIREGDPVEEEITEGVEVHLYAGKAADRKYTSVFFQVRFRDARLLFTGDVHCEYELKLLGSFDEDEFRSDILKVTHHGSSTGTSKKLLCAVRPGIAIASTANHSDHRLELDTLARLQAGGQREIFETRVKGDIILRTDGNRNRGGVVYHVESDPASTVAAAVGAEIGSIDERDTSDSLKAQPCKEDCN